MAHPAHSHRPGTARAALSYRDFRLIWFGLFLSNIGTWMQNFTLPAYIEHRTESAALVGLLVFTQLGPLLLLSIPAGVLADRLPRRPFLIGMQLVQMVFSVALAGLVARRLRALDAVRRVAGDRHRECTQHPCLPGQRAAARAPLRPRRRGEPQLGDDQRQPGHRAGAGCAPCRAGRTTPQLFLVNAVTYLFLVGALLLVTVPDVRGNHPERGWRRLLSGINIARHRKVLARVLGTMAVFSVVCLPFVGLFPSVARRNFDMDVDGIGYKLLYTTWGIGACLGALAVGTVLASFDRRRIVVIGLLLFSGSLAAFALVRMPAPAFPIAFVLGFAYFLTATALITIFQENLADTERAVTMPLWFMAFGGSVPIGNLIFGPIMDAIGARWVLLLGAVIAVGLARWSDLRRLPASAYLPHSVAHGPGDTGSITAHGIVAGR